MKIEEALAIIEQVCADFKGTLKDHQTIQQAIRVVRQQVSGIEAPPAEHAAREVQGNE